MAGAFIAFEGIAGSGKKRFIDALAEKLRSRGKPVTIITFPNFETEIARLTRRVEFDSHTLSLLYAADRSFYQERIKGLLERGDFVIADRYCYSNFAYQSARGIPLDWLIKIEQHIIKPAMVFFIDVVPEEAMKRLQQASIEDFTKKDLLERLQRERETIEKIREVYLHLAQIDAETKWIVVDSTLGTENIQNQIWQAAADFFRIQK